MSHKQAIFMETTDVPPERTAAEIVSLLIETGAREITQVYGAERKIEGVKFLLEILPGMFRHFQLPARTEPVYQILKKRRSGYLNDRDKAKLQQKAERVAWRQLFRWCQAQTALIQCGMAAAAETFLPYMQDDEGRSLFQVMLMDAQKQLPEKTQ